MVRCAMASRLAAGLAIFCKKLAEDGIEHLLGQQLLKLGVLLFEVDFVASLSFLLNYVHRRRV